ncbi:hypothetical protein [Rhizobium sp. PAMB 3182]
MTEAVKIYFSKEFCKAKKDLGLTNKMLTEVARDIRSNPLIGKQYSPDWPMFREASVKIGNRTFAIDFVYIEELSEVDCSLISEVNPPSSEAGNRDALWYLEVGSRLLVVVDRLLKLLT